jgi:SulP family sulfate permease
MTFFLTVFIDLNTGVQTGIMLAGLLFIKRMIDVTGIIDTKETVVMPFDEADEPVDVDDAHAISKKIVPSGVEVYEINGPFFFGVADRLKNVLGELEEAPRVFILRMRHVPMVDATGLHALEEFFDLCKSNGTILVLSGVNERIRLKMQRLGFEQKVGKENIADHIDTALIRANQLLDKE